MVLLNAPYSPKRLMCENKRVIRCLLILRLIVRCALWFEKYGSYILAFVFRSSNKIASLAGTGEASWPSFLSHEYRRHLKT